MLKEKLRRLSPPGSDEVLLKQKIKPVNTPTGISFVGTGKKTVDIQQIKERFSSLGVGADWKRIDRITEARNNIEHYWTDKSTAQLKEVVSSTFVAIGPFLVRELGIEPVDILGENTWNTLLEESEAYEAQRKECMSALNSVKWLSETLAAAVEYLRCPHCHSHLVRPADLDTKDPVWSECRCSFCGSDFSLSDEKVSELVAEELAGEAYIAMTDGGDPPYTGCPHCGAEAYVRAEDKCVVCLESRTYTECAICGTDLDTDEQDFNGLCGYHYNVVTKDN